MPIVRLVSTPAAFSRGRGQPICRLCSRPGSSSCSTLGLRGRSDSTYPTSCSRLLTRSSNNCDYLLHLLTTGLWHVTAHPGCPLSRRVLRVSGLSQTYLAGRGEPLRIRGRPPVQWSWSELLLVN